MLFGKTIYRDIWFDKPPLVALFSLVDGRARRLAAAPGRCSLRSAVPAGCATRFARDLWSRREGVWAAGLAGFFLIFDFPAAVIPAASDMLMLAPHVAAVWMAWKRRPFWSGALAGVAFWISPKALFVAAACALWNPAGIPWMAAGFAAVGGAGSLGPVDAVARWAHIGGRSGSGAASTPPARRKLRRWQRAGAHGGLDGLSRGHRDRGLVLPVARARERASGSGPAGRPFRSRAWPWGCASSRATISCCCRWWR